MVEAHLGVIRNERYGPGDENLEFQILGRWWLSVPVLRVCIKRSFISKGTPSMERWGVRVNNEADHHENPRLSKEIVRSSYLAKAESNNRQAAVKTRGLTTLLWGSPLGKHNWVSISGLIRFEILMNKEKQVKELPGSSISFINACNKKVISDIQSVYT